MIDPHDEYRRIGAFYEDLQALLDWPDAVLFGVDEAVSGWSPAQHLYHIALANGRMLKAVETICAGHPAARPEGGPNEQGRAVLASGDMRSLRLQAPASVAPPATVSREELATTLARSRQKYAAVEALLPSVAAQTGRLPHPFMGPLNAVEWLRTIRIHSLHHLATIRAIAAAHA